MQQPQQGQHIQQAQHTQQAQQVQQQQQAHQAQQAQRPQPSYSPPQHSPSPAHTPQPQYQLPPNNRPRTSAEASSQPQSQYGTPSYGMSPQATVASPGAIASPTYQNMVPPTPPPQQQHHPYGANGHTVPSPVQTPTLALPETRPVLPPTPAPLTPLTPSLPNQQPIQQYTNATMTPIAPPPPVSTPGAMLPPSKPVSTKEYDYDVSDSLAGTGIDLRAEEQYLAELYGGSFAPDARTGLPANAAGGKNSFYGAGPANQPAEATSLSQEQFEVEAAKRAWDEAAQRLAVSRSIELMHPFLNVANLHYRFDKIAKEHGLSLMLDTKNPVPTGKMRTPQEFPPPKVVVQTVPGPDSTIVSTKATSFIPTDAYLVDQLALLSIATKHRLRALIEDADNVATHRQTTSHGEIPEEWADVAVPLRTGLDSLPEEATSPTSLKRSFDSFSNGQAATKGAKVIKDVNAAVRHGGTVDRDAEEARLRKRQKRLNPEAAQAGSRAGSAVPGTPGTAAPEGEAVKTPSKKELKKGAAAARLAEASSTANANQTLSALMGVGGFGRKKKQYNWMKSAGSGPSTPRANSTDAGTPGTGGAAKGVPEKTTLTQDGRMPRLGTWREDKEKGKNIQLRDLVTVLEIDGLQPRELQDAYDKLDNAPRMRPSQPGSALQ
ncbi:hypothetical protein QBC35DRAFT_381714 [Podospora australis]|uniref:Transcription initiation factor TFIID subunit 4 n=1 Tax=Podospora australis TaxID=1536484 RepID=A0AAN6WWW1_9PEZI|nr:hypothetical protein QBC35DRAFT_381714 [Podospora australis]